MNSLAKTYCIVIELFQKGLLGTRIFYWTLAKNIEEKIYFHFCKKQKKKERKEEKNCKRSCFQGGSFYQLHVLDWSFFYPRKFSLFHFISFKPS